MASSLYYIARIFLLVLLPLQCQCFEASPRLHREPALAPSPATYATDACRVCDDLTSLSNYIDGQCEQSRNMYLRVSSFCKYCETTLPVYGVRPGFSRLGGIVISTTMETPTECPGSANNTVPSTELTPVNGSSLLLGFPDTLGELVVVNSTTSSSMLLNVTDQSITIKNATYGDFGLLANGTIFYTTPDCSITTFLDFSVVNQTIHGHHQWLRRQTAAMKDYIDVDLFVRGLDNSQPPPSCPLTLALICKDITGDTGESVSELARVQPSEFFGECDFPPADVYNNCIKTISAVLTLFDAIKSLYDNIENIIEYAPTPQICASSAVALGIFDVSLAGVPTAAYAAWLVGCAQAIDTLKGLIASGLVNYASSTICQALHKGSPDYLYGVQVLAESASDSSGDLIFETTVTGMVPPDIQTLISVDLVALGCFSTTSGSSIATPTSSTETPTSSISTTTITLSTSSSSSLSSSSLVSSTTSQSTSILTSTSATQSSASPTSTRICNLPEGAACNMGSDCCAGTDICLDFLCVPLCDDDATLTGCSTLPDYCITDCGQVQPAGT